jgi:chromate transporter
VAYVEDFRYLMSIKPSGITDIFLSFFKIGLFTIGGGLAMIPLIERVAVEKKRWIHEDEIADIIAICQSVPGVIAINISIFIGYKRAGMKGALAAVFGVVLPSFIIILFVSQLLIEFHTNPYVQKAFVGAKAGVTALLAVVVIRLWRQVVTDVYTVIIALVSFASVIIFGVHPFIVITVGGLTGFTAFLIKRYVVL